MTKHISTIEPSSGLAEPKAGSAASPAAPGTAKPTPAHVDAISQLFTELELAYHNQFHKAFPDNASLQMAKQLWMSVLADLDPDSILAAGRQAMCDSNYLPTLNTLRDLGERQRLRNVPDCQQAFQEACRAQEPKNAVQWTHPIVYHAGTASDWYFLKTQPESRTFPVFERNYTVLLERLKRGETLDAPVATAITHQKEKSAPLSTEEQQARLRTLREQLDL